MLLCVRFQKKLLALDIMWKASRFLSMKPSSDGQKHSNHTNTHFDCKQEEKFRQMLMHESTAHQPHQVKMAMSQGACNNS